MKPPFLAQTLLLTVLTALSLGGCADLDTAKEQPSFYRNLAQSGAQLDPNAAASMISGFRQNNGLAPVTLDPVLMRVAEQQAAAMARSDKLDHNAGGPFAARMKAAGYLYKSAAEDIGAGYYTLAEAFSGWRDSPPHRAKMLLKDATRIGIAAVFRPGSKYKVFWVLVLAAPVEAKDLGAPAEITAGTSGAPNPVPR